MSIWNATEWNYRISDRRTILVKNKNPKEHKILAEDMSTKLPFVLEVSNNIQIKTIQIGREYLATLKVYTAKSTGEVKAAYVELFQALDVDQPTGNFLATACYYPNLIRFELTEIEG